MDIRRVILGTVCSALCVGTGTVSAQLKTDAEGALKVAARLIEEGGLGEAEAILRTLAASDPFRLDMRPVDALAAQIAYRRGDTEEAARILRALVAYDPEDHVRRFDLIQLLIMDGQDRAARRQLEQLFDHEPPVDIREKARAAWQMLEERRVFRLDVRASAAPSTNVNTGPDMDNFNLYGFLPSRLDDMAQQRSGLGVSYSATALVTPPLTKGVRGHVAAGAVVSDYSHADFDQAVLTAESGVRFGQEAHVSGVATATAERQYFAGEPYAKSAGARVALERMITNRLRLGAQVSALQVDYDDRDDRDGPVFRAGLRLDYAASGRLRLSGAATVIREATMAPSEANSQYVFSPALLIVLPWQVNLGLTPRVTFRRFDKAAAIYAVIEEGELVDNRREDLTIEMGSSLAVRNFEFGGFRPSLSYRYTENNSTVDLFDYNRHAVDIGFARVF